MTKSTGPQRFKSPKIPSLDADVVIIGAGLAGLAAARRLKDRGVSVLVLEARSRVGGRAWSETTEPGLTIDLGAQLFSDVQTNISALVDEIGLTRVAINEGGQALYVGAPGGHHVEHAKDQVPLSILGQLDYFNAQRVFGNAFKDFEARAKELDHVSAEDFLRQMAFGNAAFKVMAAPLEEGFCRPLSEIAAFEMLKQIQPNLVDGVLMESEQWFLEEGTMTLAQYLAAQIGDGLLLRTPVTGFSQDERGVAVKTPGGVIRAGRPIVAVPPQLYKDIGLAELLPMHKQSVIDSWVRGDAIKTVLIFERPWWRDEQMSGASVTHGHLFNGTLDCSPKNKSRGVLLLFSTSQSGRRLSRMIDEEARIAAAIAHVEDLAGGQVPPLLAGRSINWSEDRWAQGGYASRRGFGGWLTAPDMFAPVGNIHFAGTETATEWRSFMEGALCSAERAAGEVLGLA